MAVTQKDIAFKRKIDRAQMAGRKITRKDIMRAIDIRRGMDREVKAKQAANI